jgi:predicted amidophosphoribosyltransferase
MVYDDVCTTGWQLATVARYLADEGGAAAVYGLVLARTPWAT